MGTKMAVANANILMAKIEKEILRQSYTKPIFWKRYIDDIISMWNTSRDKIEDFLLKANSFHPTIKFTAEISETETTFLDTKVYKGDRFNKESILYVRTHFKPTETFQYTNFYSCHPPGVTKGFIKGEALRLLRTNSSPLTFEENMSNFKTRLQNRGYPARIVEKHLSEIKFSVRKMSLAQKDKTAQKKILPFVTQYHPALPNLKDTLLGKWHLIDNHPLLREIFKEPPIISYRKGKSLKDILVKAKL
jgi:peptide-methionine (R)-S-oxide reductase